MVWILIVALLLSSDQLLKALVTTGIPQTGGIVVIEGFFVLVNRTNTGGAWSLFADQSWGLLVLSIVASLASVVIIIMMVRIPNTRVRLCLALILSGSIGNLIDRVFYSGVTDYLNFHFGSYEFPTFNLADSLIVCGTIALILLLLLHPEWLASGSERHRSTDPE
jgi:signal peptidase II